MRALVVSPSDTTRFDEVERPDPTPGPHDLLVEVKAVALNPVDTKVRGRREGRILGWDASGVVVGLGSEVTRFRVGDEVYYAGDLTREGCNATLHAVDERIVGRKPRTLDHLRAAALPLTALTAWEALYELAEVKPGRSLLVINSAGGVGSIALQLAKRMSRLEVIGTASRPQSVEWSRKMGADHVIDHRGDMPAQLKRLGRPMVDYILCCHNTVLHFETMAEVIAPGGRIVSIVESDVLLPMGQLFAKRVSFAWEFMFSKAMYETPDMVSQHEILNQVAELVDGGTLESTLTEDAGRLDAAGLAEAHRRQAASILVGKLGFTV